MTKTYNEHGVSSEALRAELDDIEKRTANKGSYWTPIEGRNTIRLLPTWAAEKPFSIKLFQHYIRAKSQSYACLNKMKGEKCRFCEAFDALNASGDKQRAGAYRPNVRYILQVIDRKNPEAGVQIFNTGATVFKGIASLLDDPDWSNLIDLEKGTDLIIDRSGAGLDTTYPSIRPRKDPSPAGVKKEDLLDLEATINWLDYAEMTIIYDEIAGDAPASATSSPDTSTGDVEAPSKPSTDKPECYTQFDRDAEKCKDCPQSFDCEIDTKPAT